MFKVRLDKKYICENRRSTDIQLTGWSIISILETLTLKGSAYSLLSGYRFFSNTNMIKKIFLFADRCTRKRSLQISMKRNPEYTGEDSLVSFSLFSVSTYQKINILSYEQKCEFEFTFS